MHDSQARSVWMRPTRCSGVSKSLRRPARLLMMTWGWRVRIVLKSFSESQSVALPPRPSNQMMSTLP